MGEFFHGWRRKAGCALLVMAAMLMSAWFRSQSCEDHVRLALSRQKAVAIHILGGRIGLTWEWQDEHGIRHIGADGGVNLEINFDPDKSIGWQCYPADDAADEEFNISRWFVDWGTFCCGEWVEGPLGTWLVQAPCLLIAFPLTILSAYLILRPGKRPAKRPQNDQTPAAGA